MAIKLKRRPEESLFAIDKGKTGPKAKRIGFQAGLLVLLMLALSNSAMATIETIKGSLTPKGTV